MLRSWEEDEEMVECLLLGLDDGSLDFDRRERERGGDWFGLFVKLLGLQRTERMKRWFLSLED